MKLHLIKNRARFTEWFSRLHKLGEEHFPMTIAVYRGRTRYRSLNQNALAWDWYRQIANWRGDHTVNEVRAECKLRIGIPILRAENPEFREQYDAALKGLPYAAKLKLMVEPVNFPVSSIMTVKQMSSYLDCIQREWAERGLFLEGGE